MQDIHFMNPLILCSSRVSISILFVFIATVIRNHSVKRIMNETEMRIVCNGVALAQLETQSRLLSGRTEENQEISQSG
jgi:hypothetical protein